MGLKEVYEQRYKASNVDTYWNSHQEIAINNDFGVAHFYNRKNDGMLLYGLNELIRFKTSQPMTMQDVDDAEKAGKLVGVDSPRELLESVVKDFGGYLPLQIDALPDGTFVPRGTPFIQIKNTVKGYERLVYFLEPYLMRVFFPSGCATKAFHMRRYLDSMGYSVHRICNFAYRSYNSDVDAYWGDTAWGIGGLTSSDGFAATNHYPEAGFNSIIAGAHCTMQAFDDEMDGFKKAIDVAATKPNKMCACPIDTYDADRNVFRFEQIASYAKQKGVTFVFRLDSGKVFAQAKKIMNRAEMFAYDNVRVIISDGIQWAKVPHYDITLKSMGINPNLVAFGIGGDYHRDISRETHGLAMKACFSNGKDVMKLAHGKESIAGEVELAYVFGADKKTLRLKIFTPEHEMMAQTPSAYVTVYRFDPQTQRRDVYEQHLVEIAERAASFRNNSILQTKVDMDESVRRRNYKVREKVV